MVDTDNASTPPELIVEVTVEHRDPDCVRCLTATPATTVELIGYGDGVYRLPLCERHADMLQTDIFGWIRMGVLVEDRDPTPLRQLGIPAVSHVVQVPATPVPDTSTEGPAGFDESADGSQAWQLSGHAAERAELRRVSHEEILAAASRPTRVQLSDTPGRQTRTRGDVRVVVNAATNTIVTVLPRISEEMYVRPAS